MEWGARPVAAGIGGQPQRPALLLAVGGVLAGTGMDAFGKFAMVAATPWQGVLLRWGCGLLLLVVLFLLLRRRPRMRHPAVHLLRIALNLVGSFCFFHALASLPLALVVTIFYAEPLLALPFARLLLRERVGRLRLAALFLGFAGILLATRPTFAAAPMDLLTALLGAAAWALTHVVTKAQGGRESVLDLMFWMAAGSSAAALPLALLDWVPLSQQATLAFLAVALCGLANSLLVLTALQRADALLVAGIGYLALPLGFLCGWLLYGEPLDDGAVSGGCLVLLAMLLLAASARPAAAPPVAQKAK